MPSVTIRSGGAESQVRAIIRGQADLNGGVGDPGAAIFLDGMAGAKAPIAVAHGEGHRIVIHLAAMGQQPDARDPKVQQ